MIDRKLISKAKNKSRLIAQIDASWREFVEKIKQETFRMPFQGDYCCLVKADTIFVEGYSGLLLVDKLYYKHKTYFLNTPVKYYPFKLYGLYDRMGRFRKFMSDPEIGFHYLGLTDKGHDICTGEVQYLNPESIGLLKEACLKIVKAFRVINLESLGTVLLPESFTELRDILESEKDDKNVKFEKLLTQKLIREII